MSQIFAARSLSCLWSTYNLYCLCCLIVLTLNTCHFVYSSDNSTDSQCWCNSTIAGSKRDNTTENICNCTQDKTNCTKSEYQLKNGTCVKCFCKPNGTASCNCSNTQKPQSKLTCLPGQFLVNSSDEEQRCESCNCNANTSLNQNCNNRTGQCACQEHVTGQRCTICVANHTEYHSNSGGLLNCSVRCPKGFKRTATNQCIKENSSLPFTKEATSSIPEMSSTPGVSTSRTVFTTISSTEESVNQSSTWLSQDRSTYFVTSSPSLTIKHTMKSSPITSTLPSATTTLTPTTTTSPTTTILPPTTTTLPPTTTTLLPDTTTLPSATTILPSDTTTLPSATTILPSATVKSLSQYSSPSITTSPSPSPTSSKVSFSTGKPVTTRAPTTAQPTTRKPPTTGQKSTSKPDTETQDTQTGYPTTKAHHTSEKMPSQDREKTDVLVIVLTCLGVLVILGIAIAVGCWCLRAKRKPSTPFWTVELSSTRNEDSDFALLDPITNEPHKKSNDTSDVDTPVTEHSRYYAYI